MTTAYRYNARPRTAAPAASGYCAAIDRLLEAGNEFLDCGFDTGVLYRGVTGDWRSCWTAGACGDFAGNHPLSVLERELRVRFLSHELSDALSLARLWESDCDAAVLVVAARTFASRHARGRAAVLAYAEPGVVFKYPFLVDPLAPAEVLLVVVPPSRLAVDSVMLAGMPPAPPVYAPRAGSRADIEADLRAALAARGLDAALSRHGADYPRRHGAAGCSNRRE